MLTKAQIKTLKYLAEKNYDEIVELDEPGLRRRTLSVLEKKGFITTTYNRLLGNVIRMTDKGDKFIHNLSTGKDDLSTGEIVRDKFEINLG